MFVLPKGTLVHFCGLPFRLLEDVPTDGLEENYRLALAEQAGPKTGVPPTRGDVILRYSTPRLLR